MQSRYAHSGTHVRGLSAQAVVVNVNVELQQAVGIDTLFFHASKHLLAAEVCEQGIVELNVAAPAGVEIRKLLTVCLRDVGEVLL